MKEVDLIPLKRVLAEVGVSRATLWRALNSGIEGFPDPTIVRGRMYWNAGQLTEIEMALDAYKGRGVFEKTRKRAKLTAESRHNNLLQLKKLKTSRRRKRVKRPDDEPQQGDFFQD